MSDNPYAAPAAFAAESRPMESDSPPFFAVSLPKLVLLAICTFGFYKFYWFYKNWKLIKAHENSDIYPFWRTFFGILFCYQCFEQIRDAGVSREIPRAPPVRLLAAGWILLTLAGRLPEPYWYVSFASTLLMLPVQAYANRINAHDAPTHDPNSRLSAWNWVAIVVGGIVFMLFVFGTIFPEFGDAS